MISGFPLQTPSSRIFGLDVLRAAAILFVVLEHADFLLPAEYRFITRWLVFDGVSVFFVLSGFLIGGILIRLLEEQMFSTSLLWHFWKRRWFRTLPNYFLVLLVLLLLNSLFTQGFSMLEQWRYFFFSQNLNTPHPPFFPEAWSLCVEEWFYLLLPLLIGFILIAKLNVRKALLRAAVLIFVFSMGMRVQHFLTIDIIDQKMWDLIFRKQVATRLDSLMVGVMAAWMAYYQPQCWQRIQLPAAVFGILLLLFGKFLAPTIFDVASFYQCVLSFFVGSVATALLLPWLSSWRQAKGKVPKVVTHISLISYSMYLLNLSVVQYWIIDRLPWEAFPFNGLTLCLVKYVLLWALLLPGATWLYRYFEVRMMAARD